MEPEIRKLPRKTVITIVILVVLGMIFFFLVSAGKAAKAQRALAKLGFKDVSHVTVYATEEFLREDINVKGIKYTISFTNNITNEKCKGFVLHDYKGNVEKDLLCTKERK